MPRSYIRFKGQHFFKVDGLAPKAPPRAGGKGNEESRIQKSCVLWWNVASAGLGYDRRLLYAVPNGAVLGNDPKTRAIRGRILKDEGLRAGCPDLNLDIPIGDYHGLRIEMKRPGAHPDDEQVQYHVILRAKGYRVEVCRSLDEFMKTVTGYLSDTQSPAKQPAGGEADEADPETCATV